MTDFGKINLAVIALSVVVGVQAQTSEYIKQNAASDIAKKSMENLIRNNQTVLLEVRRGLEPIPEFIWVHYDEEIEINADLEAYMKQSIGEHFGDLSNARESEEWEERDDHTKVINSKTAGPMIAFDEDSVLISKDIASRLFEKEDSKVVANPFKISFSRKLPSNPSCVSLDWPFEMEYEYDYERSRNAHAQSIGNAFPGRYTFSYGVNRHTLAVEAVVVLSLDNWLTNSASVLDRSENYVLVQPEFRYSEPAQLSSLHVEIGHRSFIFSRYADPHDDGLLPLRPSSCRDSFIARLPKLE